MVVLLDYCYHFMPLSAEIFINQFLMKRCILNIVFERSQFEEKEGLRANALKWSHQNSCLCLLIIYIGGYVNLTFTEGRFSTFISNARLKFSNFQNQSRKILRTDL